MLISLPNYSDPDIKERKNISNKIPILRTRISHCLWRSKTTPNRDTSLIMYPAFANFRPPLTTHFLDCIILRYSIDYGHDEYRDSSLVI
jgi:hypothetical protein